MLLGEAEQAPVTSKKCFGSLKKARKARPPKRLQGDTALPTMFVDCSRLLVLELCCKHLKRIPLLPSSLRRLALGQFHHEVELPNVSNLEKLTYLSICCVDPDVSI